MMTIVNDNGDDNDCDDYNDDDHDLLYYLW